MSPNCSCARSHRPVSHWMEEYMSTENNVRRLTPCAYLCLLFVLLFVLTLFFCFKSRIRVTPLSDIEMVSICRQFRKEHDCEKRMSLANNIVKHENAFLAGNRRTRHAIEDFVTLLGTPDVYGDGFCDYFISTNKCPWIVLSFRSHHRKSVVDALDIGEAYP